MSAPITRVRPVIDTAQWVAGDTGEIVEAVKLSDLESVRLDDLADCAHELNGALEQIDTLQAQLEQIHRHAIGETWTPGTGADATHYAINALYLQIDQASARAQTAVDELAPVISARDTLRAQLTESQALAEEHRISRSKLAADLDRLRTGRQRVETALAAEVEGRIADLVTRVGELESENLDRARQHGRDTTKIAEAEQRAAKAEAYVKQLLADGGDMRNRLETATAKLAAWEPVMLQVKAAYDGYGIEHDGTRAAYKALPTVHRPGEERGKAYAGEWPECEGCGHDKGTWCNHPNVTPAVCRDGDFDRHTRRLPVAPAETCGECGKHAAAACQMAHLGVMSPDATACPAFARRGEGEVQS